jgi:hypothetical protein
MLGMDAGLAQMIRIDALWLATGPLDMHASTESALARVVSVFGAGPALAALGRWWPHHRALNLVFARALANWCMCQWRSVAGTGTVASMVVESQSLRALQPRATEPARRRDRSRPGGRGQRDRRAGADTQSSHT